MSAVAGDDVAPNQLPPEPDRRLASAVLGAWIVAGTALAAGVAVASAALLPVLDEVDGLPGWVQPVLVVLVAVTCLLSAVVLPVARYRTWRYAVRPEEIDLLRGWFVRRRTVIPMARVQHVETERDVFDRMFDIATIKVHTAAETHTIPGVPETRAAELRTEIARRARVVDEV